MWYDKYPAVPKRDSPLETLFILVHVARRDAEFLSTSAQVRIALAAYNKSDDTAKRALEAFEKYADTLLPFLGLTALTSASDNERLMQHIQYPMEIDVHAMRHDKQKALRARGLEKFKLKGAP